VPANVNITPTRPRTAIAFFVNVLFLINFRAGRIRIGVRYINPTNALAVMPATRIASSEFIGTIRLKKIWLTNKDPMSGRMSARINALSPELVDSVFAIDGAHE
jgi:hypothetical protein